MRIAFLSNYTNDLIIRAVKKNLKHRNIGADFFSSGFNQYAHDILLEDSHFYQFKPELIFISIDLNFLLLDLFLKNLTAEEFKNAADKRIAQLFSQLGTLGNRLPNSKIIIDNFYIDSSYSTKTLEYNSNRGIFYVAHEYNIALYEFKNQRENFLISDILSLIQKYGEKLLFDRRLYYLSKSRWSNLGTEKLSEVYFGHINAYRGFRKKCIVLDLDNTLWGGIVGQDSKEKILLSNDGVGRAFYDFQVALLKLYNMGIILAICSKNNENDALDVIKNHPYMVLRQEHFAVMKINWESKDKNLREIASELNIGLDSIVFFDDSSFERNLVLSQIPELTVPDFPEDASNYTEFLSELDYFNFHSLTTDDVKRNKSYKDNLLRKKTEESSSNIEEYYRSLEMTIIIKSIDEFSLPRIVQLINKTNQFNLTTKRYSEAEIKHFMQDKRYTILHISLNDKFGESGIVGVVILVLKDESFYIDTFLLSCRVIGRTIESAILSHVASLATLNGYHTLTGEYIQTEKNEPCKEFYMKHHFKNKSTTFWELNLDEYKIGCPEWVKIIGD